MNRKRNLGWSGQMFPLLGQGEEPIFSERFGTDLHKTWLKTKLGREAQFWSTLEIGYKYQNQPLFHTSDLEGENGTCTHMSG